MIDFNKYYMYFNNKNQMSAPQNIANKFES